MKSKVLLIISEFKNEEPATKHNDDVQAELAKYPAYKVVSASSAVSSVKWNGIERTYITTIVIEPL